MNKTIQKRLLRTAIFCVLALIIGAGTAYWQISTQASRVLKQGVDAGEAPQIKSMAGLELGGPFNLTNHLGEKVTEQTYAGRYKLIYFGFTYCPAICPTELQKMRQVMKGLDPAVAEQIVPLFITTDPERDDIAAMKDYVSLFHPRLIGLTGTEPQIKQITKAYRIFAKKMPLDDGSDYTIDHSSFTYLMGPNDELVAMYRVKDTPDFMAKDIAAKVGVAQD